MGSESLTPNDRSIAVLAAVHSEISPLIKSGARRARQGGDSFSAWEGSLNGSNLLLVLTGMGRRRAAEAARLVLDRRPVSMLLSVGFCGALSADLRVGDLVLCQRLMVAESDPGSRVIASDPSLVQAALRLATRNRAITAGTSLVVDRIIRKPDEKKSLRAGTGADVVEMESYWIGQVCEQKGIPFLALRAVSDQADDLLPDLGDAVDQPGSMEWAAARSLFRHPGEWGRLLHFIQNMGAARRSLNQLLVEFIGRNRPGMGPG
jgi:adenosylhomocysteine nucleosidase